MRLQFHALVFIFCLNLAVTLVTALNLPGAGIIPATTEITTQTPDSDPSAIVQEWTPPSGIFIVGDIISGLNFLWRYVRMLIDGFPALIESIGMAVIPDASGQVAFSIIAWALRGVFYLLMSIFIIEFISGRVLVD